MANTINVGLTTTTNTFNQWRITDNLMANDVNEIARGNFVKPTGNVTISQGFVRIANATGGVILDVADDTNIDGTLTVYDVEVDNATNHMYVDCGDIRYRRMGQNDFYHINTNTTIYATNISFTNAASGTLNVNNQYVTINTQFANVANTQDTAVLNIHPPNVWVFGTNVNIQNTTAGSLNVFNRLTHVNSGNVYFGNNDPVSKVIVESQNTIIFGSNVTIQNTSAGTVNINNRIVEVTSPNIIYSNTHSTARFNVYPNTFYFGGHVNIANVELTSTFNVAPITNFFGTNVNVSNTTQGGTFNVSSNTFITASNVTIANTQVGGTLNVASNTNITASNVLISNTQAGGTFNVASNTTITASNVTISNTQVGGTFNVASNTTVTAANVTFSNTTAGGTLNVATNTRITAANVVISNTTVGGTLNVASNTRITAANVVISNTTVGGTLNVESNTTLSPQHVLFSNAAAAATVNVTPNTWISGNLNLASNLEVTKTSFFYGNVVASQNANVTGTVNVGSILAVTGNTLLLSNLTISRNTVVSQNANVLGTLNVASLEVGSNITTGNLRVTGLANIACANIIQATVTSLTVLDPIIAPSENDSDSYRLRYTSNTRGDGQFGVYLGSAANGNAFIKFDTALGNVWRITSNSTQGIYDTIFSTKAYYANTLQGYAEGMVTATVTSGTYTANLAHSNIFDLTLARVAGTSTALTFEKAPVTGNLFSVTLIVRQSAAAGNTLSYANTVKWSNGEEPVLASGTSGKLDVITLLTVDGGTTFFGSHAMANVG